MNFGATSQDWQLILTLGQQQIHHRIIFQMSMEIILYLVTSLGNYCCKFLSQLDLLYAHHFTIKGKRYHFDNDRHLLKSGIQSKAIFVEFGSDLVQSGEFGYNPVRFVRIRSKFVLISTKVVFKLYTSISLKVFGRYFRPWSIRSRYNRFNTSSSHGDCSSVWWCSC